MGRLVIEVTYGTEITKSIGLELASWNLEAMKLLNEAFLNSGSWISFISVGTSSGHIHCLSKCHASTFHPGLDPRCNLQV
jgi:hypothetical protein